VIIPQFLLFFMTLTVVKSTGLSDVFIDWTEAVDTWEEDHKGHVPVSLSTITY
jgi:hypothetical protein